MLKIPVFFSSLTFPKGMREISRCGCGFIPCKDVMRNIFDMGDLNEVTAPFAPFRIEGDAAVEYATFDEALRNAIWLEDGTAPKIYGNDGEVVCIVDLT